MTAVLEGGEWSVARPGRTLPPRKTRYPFYRRLAGPQGRSGRAENLVPPWDSIPDRQARSQSLYEYFSINLLTLNVNYSGHTALLTSKVAFYIFIQQI